MIEPRRHIEKARRTLASGRYLLAGEFFEQAGRDAYLVAFHAAQAFVVSRTGKEPRTHSGLRSEFARLVQQEARIPRSLVAFLGRAYELKTYADYEGSQAVTQQDAAAALGMAEEMVSLIESVLAGDAEQV